MRGIGGAVFFQAHRGGGGFERPDNTLTACRYGWGLGGIAELDVRKTLDKRIVCLHDPTLRRTTDAPAAIADLPVKELPYGAFRHLDAGRYFGPEYAGERVPLLSDVFEIMAKDPSLYAYLDLKESGLADITELIGEYGLQGRTIVAGPDRGWLADIKRSLPQVCTLHWLGGSGAEIECQFRADAAREFAGLDQIQIHLNDDPDRAGGWRYTAKKGFLEEALALCKEAKIDLEVFPWHFEKSDIDDLLGIGLRWYATDEPSRFHGYVSEWLSPPCITSWRREPESSQEAPRWTEGRPRRRG